MATIFLGLGSNLGDRRANLRGAVALLQERFTQQQVSSLYETEPVGYLEQPTFLNAVWQGQAEADAETVYAWIKEIESKLGRTPTFPNGPRNIDIDLLLYNDLILTTPQLMVPHPRMGERAFVLEPLCEVAPNVVHPVLQQRVGELLERVAGREGVRKIPGETWWQDSGER